LSLRNIAHAFLFFLEVTLELVNTIAGHEIVVIIH
jgi:hypothetical protein